MLGYYLELAVRSLRRSPGLTALMMLMIGFGVASSMTMYAVVRGLSADPIPSKSSQLFAPQIDSWGPRDRGPDGEPPAGLDYADATALMRQHRATRQSAMYRISPSVMPTDSSHNRSPILLDGYAVTSEFFPMLDVPFLYGHGWSAQEDATQAPVAVISDRLNRQIFGGGNSVGKTIDLDSHDYGVVGVMLEWNPQPVFFDTVNPGFGGEGSAVLVPFQQAVAVNMDNQSSDTCRKGTSDPNADFAELRRSDCVWISYRVELDDAASVQRYRSYLDNYASEQQKAGRFDWAPNNRLRDVPAVLYHEHVMPSSIRVSMLVAAGLLLVCLVNTVGLLLAKFLRRSGEIGVRRALGASRGAISVQFLIEAGVIGVGGGVLGLLLTTFGVLSIGLVLSPVYADTAHIDVRLLVLSLFTAVMATILAGLYPSLRAARVQPAWQLKAS
jgi:putative ABC transport system permease protein